ncbi:MAG: type II toxin-antitoxin system antitoxin [Planctomycetota bacterium]|jgi:hypothetical protein
MPERSTRSEGKGGKGKKAFLLRLDPAVHDALRRWAADEMRSLNGHLEYLLRRELRKHGREKADET